MNKKFTLIIFLFFFFLLISPILFLVTTTSFKFYREKAHVYSIAEKIGYSEKNHLNIYRNWAFGLNAAYDYIELLYSTDMTLEEFSNEVSKLGLSSVDSSLPNPPMHLEDGYFLDYKPGLTYELKLKSKQGDKKLKPYRSEWILFDESNKRTIYIIYADSGKEEGNWEYEGKPLNKKAVIEIKENIY